MLEFSFETAAETTGYYYPMYLLHEDLPRYSTNFTRYLGPYEVWTLDEVTAFDPVAGMMIKMIKDGTQKEQVINELQTFCVKMVGDFIGKEFLGLTDEQLPEFQASNWMVLGRTYAFSNLTPDTTSTPSEMQPLDPDTAQQRYRQILSEWKLANQAMGLELQVD